MRKEIKDQIKTNLDILLFTNPELEEQIRQTLEVLTDKDFTEVFVGLVKLYAKQRFIGNEVTDFGKWFKVFRVVYKVAQSEQELNQIKFLF